MLALQALGRAGDREDLDSPDFSLVLGFQPRPGASFPLGVGRPTRRAEDAVDRWLRNSSRRRTGGKSRRRRRARLKHARQAATGMIGTDPGAGADRTSADRRGKVSLV